MPEQNAAPTIADRVREILMEQLGVTSDELSTAAHLVDDLGCDSLDLVEILFALEEEFDIQVPDEVFERTGYTVGDVIALVKGKAV